MSRDPEAATWFRVTLGAIVLISLVFLDGIEAAAERWLAERATPTAHYAQEQP